MGGTFHIHIPGSDSRVAITAGTIRWALILILFAVPGLSWARAEAGSTRPIIGWLHSGYPAMNIELGWFRQGLQQQGFIDGRNVVFDHKWAEWKFDQFPALVRDLVHNDYLTKPIDEAELMRKIKALL